VSAAVQGYTSRQHHSDIAQQRLEAALVECRRLNPHLTYVLDSGAVWLRVDGHDFGIWSATLVNDRLVYCVDANGLTPLCRPSPPERATSTQEVSRG